MQEYELLYLVGESKESELPRIREAVEKMVVSADGTFLAPVTEEKRKMAYEVKKEVRGTYIARRFTLPDKDERDASETAEAAHPLVVINRALQLSKDILRFLIVSAEGLPELKAIAGRARHRPTVRFYEGKEQMKIVLEEILAEADDLWCFASPEDLFRVLGDYFDKFVERRVKKKIPIRMLAADSPKTRDRQALGAKHLRAVRILPATFEYHSNKWLWKNKIALFSFVNDLVAVVIESQELCALERAMFNYLWDKTNQTNLIIPQQ